MGDRMKFRVHMDGFGYVTSSDYAVDCNGVLFNTIDGTSLPSDYSSEQCTGLKDKNKQLAWEGDKLWSEKMKREGIIIFRNGSFRLMVGKIHHSLFDIDSLFRIHDLEIIGTIHDEVK